MKWLKKIFNKKEAIKEVVSVKFITSCNDLMMDKFIKCLLHKEYSCLILEGSPTEIEMREVWDNIFMDYLDLMDNNKTKLLAKSIKDIARNEAKLMVIELALRVLSHHYEFIGEENYLICVKNLKDYGYDYEYPRDDEARMKDLERVRSVSKMAIIKLQSDRANYDKLLNENQNKVVRESDFNETFIALSKFMGYSVKPQTTTVSEYCGMIKTISKK